VTESTVKGQARLSGYKLRLGRLFDARSGRSFVTAIDHAITLGVPKGDEDAVGTLSQVIAGGPDAVLLGPGLLNLAGHLFADRYAPAPIVRADFIINHPFLNPLGEGYRQVCSAEYAVRLGAEAIVMFLMVGAGNGELFKENVTALTQMAEAAHNVGLPLIVESVLWGTRVQDHKDPEMLAFGARLAFELGADAVKTEYTGNPETMKDIINGCPVPVLLLGGSKSADPEALWKGTRNAIEVGAKGVIYGRNVWQSGDPIGVSRKLREIIHGS
jgi:DhnA family fructose-bisphosphate aldolase class Ia